MAILGGASSCTSGEPGDLSQVLRGNPDEEMTSPGEVAGGGKDSGDDFGILVECDGPEHQCGANSPEIDNFTFHELNLDGLPNLQNFVMDTFGPGAKLFKNGEKYTMEVVDARIRGSNSSSSIDGANLVGAYFELARGGTSYKVFIDTVRTIGYPVGDGSTFEAYRFSWSSPILPPNTKRQICAPPRLLPNPTNPPPLSTRPPERPHELLGMADDEVIVFEGDRIDAIAKTISADIDPRWFNMACAGHTLSKLHLTRNTTPSGALAHGVDLRGRQATLKMLVADYCGTGKPFTVAGEPLRWKGGAMTQFYSLPTSLEARWTHEGATCLNVPRMQDTTAPLNEIPWSNLREEIEKECTIQACTNLDVHDFEGHARVSGNP